ncbi:MAG: hypothetical protein N2255_06725 [Kiritimatiellae bacterium]|nr:hypothetical protein [Kiritimatiellia bacterium]
MGKSFTDEAKTVVSLPIATRVNSLGGYGPNGEVIYERVPAGCPSVLVDSRGNATATFMSNGATAFVVKLPEGVEVEVLSSHFDPVEKREIGVPSHNLWLDLVNGRVRRIASLINPTVHWNCPLHAMKLVKIGDPQRAFWICGRYRLPEVGDLEFAVKLNLVITRKGPAVLRRVWLHNLGRRRLTGRLWGFFNLHGTQLFTYNKQIWYDAGLSLTPLEAVVTATVPYSDILQIKRISSRVSRGVLAVEATCDYLTFVGHTSATAWLPTAVARGTLLPIGAGSRLNRFLTPTIHAVRFDLSIAPRAAVTLEQSLLYVTDAEVISAFRKDSEAKEPSFLEVEKAFRKAARGVNACTPGVKEVVDVEAREKVTAGKGQEWKFFHVEFPAEKAVSHYANSVWMTVAELYEKCRSHGARLGSGIELGTRDRAQDMWPKMKENPGRVRADLVHAMGFMYRTTSGPIGAGGRLPLREKLHGMFPRQYPSRWDDRRGVVRNDNRPYADSALWLLNSLNLYIRETGDYSILTERVSSIRLTDPDRPEASGISGNDEMFAVWEVMLEVLASYERHCDDSPYGMAQILYGDWADPVDMFGTGVVGDPTTRGQGRGTNTRLSAHLFLTVVEVCDLLATEETRRILGSVSACGQTLARLRSFAGRLRENILRWAWEEGPDLPPGFIDSIHELRADGSVPDYEHGETGYTLGSWDKRREFDGRQRRVLTTMAYGLAMLQVERDFLAPVLDRERRIKALLKTVDTKFYDPKLGLRLYTTPIANDEQSRKLVGRMGVLPCGCAENGEYHHAQAMMHFFRLGVDGEKDRMWSQFSPMLSAARDETLLGPFETPTTSYASDPEDPHFGGGMYFGLSGSVDWLVEIFQRIAGITLNLHDSSLPAVVVKPCLPSALKNTLFFQRIIHMWNGEGAYRIIPLSVRIRPGRPHEKAKIKLNGREVHSASIACLGDVTKLEFEFVMEGEQKKKQRRTEQKQGERYEEDSRTELDCSNADGGRMRRA